MKSLDILLNITNLSYYMINLIKKTDVKFIIKFFLFYNVF